MANFRFEPAAGSRPPPADKSTLSEEVFETLKNEIITGALGPGTRLVRRPELIGWASPRARGRGPAAAGNGRPG